MSVARALRPSPLGAAAGLVVDRLLGEPGSTWHPLIRFGRVMGRVEQVNYVDSRTAGVRHCVAGVALGAGAGAALRSSSVATALAVGGHALHDAAKNVGAALDRDDLNGARRLLPTLVGREPHSLDATDVSRAVVESVAENTVDAIVAPVFYAALAGASGVLAYRAINTLDAMVGHHSSRYERYGWASARLDDVVNWVPARLAALLVVLVRPNRARAVLRAVRTQAPDHPSPNAGVIEAAFAAALDVRLGGPSVYGDRSESRPPLGDGRSTQPSDIVDAVALSRAVSNALVVGLVLVGGWRRVRAWRQ